MTDLHGVQFEQSDEELARYHVSRAKALWAQVPELIPDKISLSEQYTQTLRAQSIDWHFKAADVYARLAHLDQGES